MTDLREHQVGDSIGGWRIVRPLGRGASSWVFEVVRADGTRGALKVLGPTRQQSMATEVRVLREVAHPNLVRCLDHDLAARWIVQSVASGASASSWIRRPATQVDTVLSRIIEVGEAVRALHGAGWSHRDVKPSNLVFGDGAALLDLGAATPVRQATVSGTASYAPPEWSQGPTKGPEHDTYSLGVVLYELLIGARCAQDRLAALDPGPSFSPDVRAVVRGLTDPSKATRMPLGLALTRLRSALAADPTCNTHDGASDLGSQANLSSVGRYELVQEIGRGGMGQVWRAWDAQLQRHVAIKLLHGGSAASEVSKRRFLREARALAKLQHPGLVEMLDMGTDQGTPWFAMELVSGITLADVLADGPPGEATSLRIVGALADALAHTHEHGVVHRDIKPANVLLDSEHRARLTDFGIAHDLGASTALTEVGQLVGTPNYMSPEQVRGDNITPASDVWSLGVLLYECLSGTTPYKGSSATQVLYQMMQGAVPDLRDRAPNVDPNVERLCRATLRHAPHERPTMQELADELSRLQRGEPLLLPRPSLMVTARRSWARHRSRGLAALALLGVALAVAGSMGLSWWWRSSAEVARELAAERQLDVSRGRQIALRRGGQPELAEQAIDAFVRRPEHRRTRAAARAWFERGQLAESQAEIDRAITFFGRSYAASDHAVSHLAAMEQLARLFAERRQWEPLRKVLRRYDSADGHAEVVQDARLALAQGVRDVRSMVSLDDHPSTQLVAHLLSSASVPDVSRIVGVWPDGDHVLIAAHNDPTIYRARRTPDLQVVSTTSIPTPFSGWSVAGYQDGDPLIVASKVSQGALYRYHDGELVELTSWAGSYVHASAQADPDGDGQPTIYLGEGAYSRRLLAAVQREDGWQIVTPHLPTNATQSDITAMRRVDLDDDGVDELFVAAGAWRAYDLRLFGGLDEQLQVLDRLQLGAVKSAEPIRWAGGGGQPAVVILITDAYPSRAQFREAPYTGLPPGVYLVTWRQGRLHVSDAISRQPGFKVLVADVDGDGLDDIVSSSGSHSRIGLQRPDGRFEWRDLGGLSVHAALDLDGDGAAELVGSDEHLDSEAHTWVLGAGEATVPKTSSVEVPPWDGEIVGAPLVRAAWHRAEDLVSLGLHRAAHDELLDLEMLASPAIRGHLQLRRGELLLAMGDLHAAMEAWEAATRGPNPPFKAFDELYDALVRLTRPDEARRLAARASAAGASGAWTERAAKHEDRPTMTIRAGEELSAAWQIVDPIAIHRSAGELFLEGSHTVALRRYGHWDGGPMQIDMDLTGVWSGFSSGIGVTIRPVDASQGVAVSLSSGGGGGFMYAGPRCAPGAVVHSPGDARRRIPMSTPDQPLRVRVRLDVDPAERTASCAQQIGGRSTVVAFPELDEMALSLREGPVVVEVQFNSGVGYGWSAVSLHNLTIRGVRDAAAVGPSVAHALLRRQSEAVLATTDDPLLRVLALDDLGRSQDLGPDLSELLSGDTLTEHQVQGMVRGRQGRFVPALMAHFKERWPAVFMQAWAVDLQSAPQADQVQRALIAQLPDLDRAPVADDAQGLTELLVRRASALRRQGRLAAAERHTQRSLQIGVHAKDAERAHFEAARIALARGRPEAALAHLRRAFVDAPTPEVFADHVLAQPDFDELRELPGWIWGSAR